MPTVLLVHPDPAPWLAALPDGAPEVATAATASEARAYLAGSAFDAIYVAKEVPGAEAIGALRDVLGLSTPIEQVATAQALAARLAPTVGEGPAALREVRDELARVAHALNNPLAVIMGNAQLAAELARSVPTDEMIVDAIASVGEAARELETLFAEVAALRTTVQRAIDEASR